MDSVAAFYEAMSQHKVVAAISFDYGAKHNHKELPFASYHCRKFNVEHRVIALSFVGELFKSDLLKSGGAIPDGHYEEQTMKSTVVPFRNGIMLAIAAGFAESKGALHCGTCGTCVERREAFIVAGVTDPTIYASKDPLPGKPSVVR